MLKVSLPRMQPESRRPGSSQAPWSRPIKSLEELMHWLPGCRPDDEYCIPDIGLQLESAHLPRSLAQRSMQAGSPGQTEGVPSDSDRPRLLCCHDMQARRIRR